MTATTEKQDDSYAELAVGAVLGILSYVSFLIGALLFVAGYTAVAYWPLAVGVVFAVMLATGLITLLLLRLR